MIRWAECKLGSTEYAGWCLAFIEDASKNRPVNLISNGKKPSKGEEEIKRKWLDNIYKIANDPELFFVIPFSSELLKYSPEDWYFLLRLNIFESYEDTDGELYEYEHNYEPISVKGNLYMILEAIKDGRF